MSRVAVRTLEKPRPGAWDGAGSVRPLWLQELAGGCVARPVLGRRSNLFITTLESAHDRLVQVRVRGAGALSPDQFEEATIFAYGAIAEELAESSARHPVRFWNYIPRIHRVCDDGLDRYMNFNAGRYEAFRRWFGPDNLDRLPTASGIGHDGEDLIIDVLATDVEGIAVDNPSQIPPVRYSRRYGPRPPCFARATLVRGRTTRLLVGGTASVVGEISVHHRDLTGQIEQTLKNLRSLLGSSGLGSQCEFSDLRVYHRRPGDAGAITRAVRRGFPASTRIELTRADLCRRELLVEMEGVVTPGVDGGVPGGSED
jgi:chorismate lyase/3-hydroxybenzoate synthase